MEAASPRTNTAHWTAGLASETNPRVAPARLQIIHELVRSGRYDVPAIAIAERMLERMLAERRNGHR